MIYMSHPPIILFLIHHRKFIVIYIYIYCPEKNANKRKEGQSKGSRVLEAYCKGGQGPPRAVATSKKKKKKKKVS